MYKHILVPIAPDHPAKSSNSLDIAQRLLAEDGVITLLTVMEPIPSYVAQYLPAGQQDKNRAEILGDLEKDVAALGNAEAKLAVGHPAREIEDYAENHDVDLIVIASHRPGLQDYFLGSTAARVVRHAKCAVHVLR
ncbi:universal stress protein [Pseudoruegeria sp. SHC-113]|uniref:universal stress protein n=1 Tax=Pseudoruegeria sp. SHC-113 TaxID=2855439 RepID=UPI0021BA3D07|nr:universal stress protein [Pseudoruegeria sp. SHC-113]MCT8160961.1 universal stress protein [Pseudoruegeria sp. SHC-113]